MTDEIRSMKTSDLVVALGTFGAMRRERDGIIRRMHASSEERKFCSEFNRQVDRAVVLAAELDRRIPVPVDEEEQRRAFDELMEPKR